MLNNLKIGSRLFVGFGIVLLLTTATTFYGIYNMSRIQGNLDEMAKVTAAPAGAAVSDSGNAKAGSVEALYARSVDMYKTARILMFSLTGLFIALAVIIAMYLTRSIVRPLTHAVYIADALAVGNLNKQVEVTGSDEIGKLLVSMQIMVDKLRGVMASVKMVSDNVASGSRQLSDASDNLSKGSQDLSRHIDQIVTAITEVSQTITDVAKNASFAAEASQKASETATMGRKIVDTTANDMTQIAKTTVAAALTIEELGKSSKQIGEIVAVINDIADQTNLLALNAAIEASRAGEQGKGFAVVADEIRKLAERTSQATKDIARRISSIQHASEESANAIKKASSEVESGVGLAKEASASMTSIVEASTGAGDIVHRIAAATEEGREKAFAEINSKGGMFTNRDLYVFVYDMNGRGVAHGQNTALIGKDLLNAQDPDKKFYVKERIEIARTKSRGWQNYKFLNPKTKTVEDKTAYIERCDDLIVGAGAYR
ncbi:MAG: methyl-accepting chemotaxis sensory transducer [Deltaproteobacteria bacterium]|nr:methyl-accepting chemotaxis sensory transducer [Deltaproteobacteria bacterium]